MRAFLLIALIAFGGTACGFDPPPTIDDRRFTIGGTVVGLWDGAVLQLDLDAGDRDETVTATIDDEGEFAFDASVLNGSAYSVVVAEQPEGHACAIDGANGTLDGANVAMTVRCAGPAVDVVVSAPIDLGFDAEQLTYDIATSLLVQRTSFTITAPDATNIRIGEVDGYQSGVPTPPYALGRGPNDFAITIDVGTLSRTFDVNLRRGDAEIAQFLYAKASNPGAGDSLGTAEIFDLTGFALPGAVAIDGDTMVIGAAMEDSDGSSQTNEAAEDAGAVYVFRRIGSTWIQEAYLKAANVDQSDRFGNAVAIAGDTIAVGAPYEASNANGINGDDTDDSAPNAGAVYVFRRSGTTWSQEAYIKASNSGTGDNFGTAVALSGNSLIVGAFNEASGSTSQTDDSKDDAGAAYVFTRSGVTWTQQAYLKASLPKSGQHFGRAVDIDGDTAVVGAPEDNSCYTGVNNNESDTACTGAGAVYAYLRSGSTWTQRSYIKAFNTDSMDNFGRSVAVDGDTLVVGAPEEDSGSVLTPSDDSATNRGGVYVFLRPTNIGQWAQIAFLKSTSVMLGLGTDVDVHGDMIAASHGGGGTEPVTMFHRDLQWTESSVLMSPGQPNDLFGAGVALSGDTLAVAAPQEDSLLGGIDPSDDSVATNVAAGAGYTFR